MYPLAGKSSLESSAMDMDMDNPFPARGSMSIERNDDKCDNRPRYLLNKEIKPLRTEMGKGDKEE